MGIASQKRTEGEELDKRLKDATRIVEKSARAFKLEPTLRNTNFQSKHLESGLPTESSSSSKPRWRWGQQTPSAAADALPIEEARSARSKALAPVFCDGLTPPQTTPPKFGTADTVTAAVSEHA